ncbi:MAG: DUF1844 domain-containing protein [Planctomycetota bacterium]
MSDQDQTPKLIIDSDWKSEAQAEKEKLSAKAKEDAGKRGAPQDLPPADVIGIVQILASQALTYMGAFPDPKTGRAMVALDLARFHIDLLGVLEEKTKGNLTDEENTLVTQTVHELRFQFVEVSKAVEQAVQEGRAQHVDLSQVAGSEPPAPGTPPAGSSG